MSWSATSSALEEIIEYVEELTTLTRLLIGVNNFRYGFLSRSLNEETIGPSPDEARTDRETPEDIAIEASQSDSNENEDKLTNIYRIPANLRRRKFSAFETLSQHNELQQQANLPSSTYDLTRTLSQIEREYVNPSDDTNMARLGRYASQGSEPEEDLPMSLQRIVTGRYRTGRRGNIFS
ncbi:hypothetical protein AWJ20_2830 [Sugiyamaella lignohabitans]|uniref:Uncharacterized protein n=1 Tax=Sugiyamaella lignohabitans TaxID=796027 RepID=A0A167FEQ8_9ASCO|nr:uncharacterized protein AWJ20_2830 [Sugiyamaella lignohabitans]ANB15206.1 hypothetical protein AWJ20_2830 [Sugiyamaella lignohabitans]